MRTDGVFGGHGGGGGGGDALINRQYYLCIIYIYNYIKASEAIVYSAW